MSKSKKASALSSRSLQSRRLASLSVAAILLLGALPLPASAASGQLATTASQTAVLTTAGTHRYEYLVTDYGIEVYDIDNNNAHVRTISLPQLSSGVRGSAASANGMLYIAYYGQTSGQQQMLAYNINTDQVVYTRGYSPGTDSACVTPDGKFIYMPLGEGQGSSPNWDVIDAPTGNVITSISVAFHPHNTVCSMDGRNVYMAGVGSQYLSVASVATNTITRKIGPFSDVIRPFTINGAQSLAFVNVNNFLGFQVGDINTGKVLYKVSVPGFPNPGSEVDPSHGVGITPDEKEVWVSDGPHGYVHVFDTSGLPGSAPTLKASIKVASEPKWVSFSLDGRYAYIGTIAGSGQDSVIDTTSKQVVALVAATEKFQEIDFTNGVVSTVSSRHGLGYVPAGPQAPPSLSSIGPTLGSQSGGKSVTITGANFASGATVTFGGTSATAVTVLSPTSIIATTPAHAAGAVDVVVTNSDGQSGTLSSGYTFAASASPPTVSSINPAAGNPAGGTSVTITGSNFVAGATATLGGTPAVAVKVVSPTSITATTPAHTSGAVDVVVTNSDGQSSTLSRGYTYTSTTTAPTLVQNVSNHSPSPSPSITTQIAPTTAGSLLLITGAISNSTVTMSLSYGGAAQTATSLADVTTTPGMQTQAWYVANAAAGTTSVTITRSSSSGAWSVSIEEWSGMNATPLDQSASVSGVAGATTMTSGTTPATTHPVELWWSVLNASSTASNPTISPVSPGWTQDAATPSHPIGSTTYISAETFFEVSSSTGSAQATATASQSTGKGLNGIVAAFVAGP